MTKEFLSPSEVEKMKKTRTIVDKSNVSGHEDTINEVNAVMQVAGVPSTPSPRIAINKAGKVKIDYESEGRFSIPETLHFSGYTVDHIDQFAVVNEDNVFETLITILNDLNDSEDVNVEDMLIEEFFETLIAIKAQFNTIDHIHRWICDCQENIDEADQVINETQIDLSKINYVSISTIDELFKKQCEEMFENPETYAYYIKLKYGEDASSEEFDKEEELRKIKIEEPYTIQDDCNTYKFRYMRVKDLIIAHRYVTKKYASKLKAIKQKQIHNVKAEELKSLKEEELGNINKLKGQELLRALKSSVLVEYNGNPVDDLMEKMDIYKSIPVDVALNSTAFLDKFKFGINHNQKFECPICGRSDERLLQLEFDFIEFVPTKSSPSNALRNATRGNIFMGI